MTRSETSSVYLRPGEIAIVREPAVISTVLGSCVSFTFFNRRRRLAGMCHALLPSGRGEEEGFRYVDEAARHLLESFLRQGIRREEIEVKLFGGADMFEGNRKGAPPSVGNQNVAAALDFARREGLRIAASDVGGRRGRKLLFHSEGGEVLLKRLSGQSPSPACR